MSSEPRVRVCAAHVTPVFLDTAATINKAIDLIAEASGAGADVIAFPESYVPAFPLWSAIQAPIHSHDLFRRLAAQAVRVPGPETERISEAARAHGIVVSLGINEGTAASVGCLWNSNLLFDADGRLINHHRKLVPTFFEKLTWAPGDGAGLQVAVTRAGRIGALICGENTNPLARYSLMAQGEQIHIASYPPLWPTRDPARDPADGDGHYDLSEAIRIRSAAHAFEAKCFVVVAASCLGADARQILAQCNPDAGRILDDSPPGASMVIDPQGRLVSDVLTGDEGLLYADIDLSACVEPKQFHDVVGGYNRFDVFDLRVDRRRLVPIHFSDPTSIPSNPPTEDVIDAPALPR